MLVNHNEMVLIQEVKEKCTVQLTKIVFGSEESQKEIKCRKG
jgi:hypothetical protein